MSAGRLVLVPTPIGNLGDMTFRGIEALRVADVIYAEDTRRTRQLMTHFKVPARGRLRAMPAAREAGLVTNVISAVESGEVVAVVSDAGMPGISDPGALLVREAIASGVTVDVLPGASAVPVAVVASCVPNSRFTFFGFLPRNAKERRRILETAMCREESAVFFEAPGRVVALVRTVADIDPERSVGVGRELTKLHETWIRGTAEAALAEMEINDPRGEYVIVVSGSNDATEAVAHRAEPTREAIVEALLATSSDVKPRVRAREVAKQFGVSTQQVYAVFSELGSARSSSTQ